LEFAQWKPNWSGLILQRKILIVKGMNMKKENKKKILVINVISVDEI